MGMKSLIAHMAMALASEQIKEPSNNDVLTIERMPNPFESLDFSDVNGPNYPYPHRVLNQRQKRKRARWA
jgi:hypothetical protein